jgi:hypothetical protein
MKHSNLILTLGIISVLSSASAMADSWDVTQSATASGNTTLTQGATTATVTSVQGINVIDDIDTTITTIGTIQSATLENPILKQEGGTSNSIQAVNYINAESVKGTQSTTATTNLKLWQTGTTASSTQAVNYLKAKIIGDATAVVKQEVIGGINIDLTQDTSGASNMQGLNIIDTSTPTTALADIEQEITAAEMSFTQTSSTSIQTGNGVITEGAGGKLLQNATMTTLAMSQQGTTASIQAVNYLGKAK